jgi:putative addiction module component (TIGR02574 family)
MTKLAQDLKQQLSSLPVQDRADLAYFLLHSLDEQADVNWESAWADEVEKRRAEIRNGSVKGEPAADVFAELKKKYS